MIVNEVLSTSRSWHFVPLPGIVLKNKKTGEYAEIAYFNYKAGLYDHIPVVYMSGVKESIPLEALLRRFDTIIPDTKEYEEYQKESKSYRLRRQMDILIKEQSRLESMLSTTTNAMIKNEIQKQIDSIARERNKLITQIRDVYAGQ